MAKKKNEKNQVEKENEVQENNLSNINAYNYKEHLESSFEKNLKVDLKELQKRNFLKKQDLANTKSWLDSFSTINETHVTINHSRELALLEYYSDMDFVEIDPGIKTIFQSNQKAISGIDLSDAKEEYLYAYKEYQDLLERMDDKKREDTGINSLDREEKKIKEDEKKTNKNIAEAEKKVRESKNKARASKYTVSPKSVFLGILTGNKKDLKTITDSWKSVKDAKKSLKEAKKAKKQIAERKEALNEKALRLQMSKDKLTIKIGNALEKMTTASEKIANQQEIARMINSQSKILADKLHKYYKSIDKYANVKQLKEYLSVPENNASKENLISAYPDLAFIIDNFPDNLQKNTFKIYAEDNDIKLQNNIHNIRTENLNKKLNLSDYIDKKSQIGNLQNYFNNEPYNLEQVPKEIQSTVNQYRYLNEQLKVLNSNTTLSFSEKFKKLNEIKKQLSNSEFLNFKKYLDEYDNNYETSIDTCNNNNIINDFLTNKLKLSEKKEQNIVILTPKYIKSDLEKKQYEEDEKER